MQTQRMTMTDLAGSGLEGETITFPGQLWTDRLESIRAGEDGWFWVKTASNGLWEVHGDAAVDVVVES